MNLQLPVVAPSILAADFSQLGDQLKECADSGVSWIHCDIMDGHFVPNISFGPGVVSAVRQSVPDMFLDVHLMIENPEKYVEDFADAGADLISVHYETCPHLHGTLQLIRSHGCMTGVVINPGTPVGNIEPVLKEADLVLIMSVNPGFGGQKFIEDSYEKIRKLVHLRDQIRADFLIEVDGGVGLKNIKKLVSAGVDILVAGSSVFKAENISDRIEELSSRAASGKQTLI